MGLKLDIFKALGMVVVDSRAVAIGSMAAVELTPTGMLYVYLLSGERLMFQEKAASDFIDQVTEIIRASQRAALQQQSSLLVPR